MLVENKEGHAPDLEWMLRSQQVDDEIILDLLLDEYFGEIYRIAQAKLTYTKLAFQATQETFIRAVLIAKANPPEESISDWLVAIAAEEINRQMKYLTEQRLLNSRLISALIRSKTPTTETAENQILAKEEIKAQLRSREAAVGKRSRYKEISLAVLSILAFLLIPRLVALIIPSDDIQASQPGENQSQFQEFLERERISF
jgi:DNA-directed RNA polymerase specialized sigma24 family protein